MKHLDLLLFINYKEEEVDYKVAKAQILSLNEYGQHKNLAHFGSLAHQTNEPITHHQNLYTLHWTKYISFDSLVHLPLQPCR